MNRLSTISVILLVAIAVTYVAVRQPFPHASTDEIKKFSSYTELQGFLKASSQSIYSGYTSGAMRTMSAAMTENAPSASPQAAGTATGSQDYSTTNIQVAGVDESDFVKNDGKYIYDIVGSKVVISDVFPADGAKIVSTLDFNGTPAGLFVNGDRLVVMGNQNSFYYGGPVPLQSGVAERPMIRCSQETGCPAPVYQPPKAFVYVYDISDRASPVLKRNVTIDGSYTNSRMVGDYVYVIFNSYVNGGDNVTLPTVTSNGNEKAVQASDVYYFDAPDSSYTLTTIMSVNTKDDLQDYTSKEILMGYSQNIYVSQGNIYVTYQKTLSYYDYMDTLLDRALMPSLPADIVSEIDGVRNAQMPQYAKFGNITQILQDYFSNLTEEQQNSLQTSLQGKMEQVQAEIEKEMQKTVIHRISISNGAIDYKAHGEVPGSVLNQFSMDESNGYFRIATTTRSSFIEVAIPGNVGMAETTVARTASAGAVSQNASPMSGQAVEPTVAKPVEPPAANQPTMSNNVYVLDMSLNTVGKLENIAPDESIYAARFMGNRAYLVTFKSIDPLFVIDLSDPASPKILGQLKIPGFSDYLHPYDETHIIGVGKEVNESVDADKVHSPNAVYYTAVGGVKLSLFDVSDVSNPKEIAKVAIGDRGTDSEALRDHKAFLFNRDKGLLVIPIMLYQKSLEPFFYGGYEWQGAYVFNVSLDNGFAFRGRITHAPGGANSTSYYYYGPYSVTRSLYIDGVLYTVSQKEIKMNSLGDLSELNKIDLPSEAEPYPIPLVSPAVQ